MAAKSDMELKLRVSSETGDAEAGLFAYDCLLCNFLRYGHGYALNLG